LQDLNRKKPNPKNRVPDYIEQAVIAIAIENPALGQIRASLELSNRGVLVLADIGTTATPGATTGVITTGGYVSYNLDYNTAGAYSLVTYVIF
jgi:hypothetical protein